jgi:hypothetical protein
LGRRELSGRPVVDEQVAVLQAAMTRLWPRLAHRTRRFRSVPTHDIDRLRRYGTTLGSAPYTVFGRLRAEGPRSALAAGKGVIDVHLRGHDDPFFSFDRLMDESESSGAVSSFNFIPRYRPRDGTPPSRYSMRSRLVAGVLRRIVERGHTIGIHPGYDSFDDPGALGHDVDAIRSAVAAAGADPACLGGRHHYLRWDPQRSPGWWDAAGLAYDSSFGFAEVPGFRAGTSRPYRLWDHVEGRATSVEERPLIWMDASIFAVDPAGLQSDAVLTDALELKQQCRRHGGDFTFLMHNDGYAAPGGQHAYRTLLHDR